MPDLPVRIQRKRTAGWRAPPGTLMCTRPGQLGCPYVVWHDKLSDLPWVVSLRDLQLASFISRDEARDYAIDRFRRWLLDDTSRTVQLGYLNRLRGAKYLGCFCREDQLCHCDVYLELLRRANG